MIGCTDLHKAHLPWTRRDLRGHQPQTRVGQ